MFYDYPRRDVRSSDHYEMLWANTSVLAPKKQTRRDTSALRQRAPIPDACREVVAMWRIALMNNSIGGAVASLPTVPCDLCTSRSHVLGSGVVQCPVCYVSSHVACVDRLLEHTTAIEFTLLRDIVDGAMRQTLRDGSLCKLCKYHLVK